MKKSLLLRFIILMLLLSVAGYADSGFDVNVRIGDVYRGNMEKVGYRIAFNIDTVSQGIEKIRCYTLMNSLEEIEKNKEFDEYVIDMKADAKFEVVVFVAENRDGEYDSSRYLLIEIREGIVHTEWIQDNKLPKVS